MLGRIPPNEKIIEMIKGYWGNQHPTARFDARVMAFEINPREAQKPDWISTLLAGGGFTYRTIAERMKVSRQDVFSAAQREAEGNITLKKMQEIAAAAECEFVYAFVPKNEKYLSNKVIKKAAAKLELSDLSEHITDQKFAMAFSVRLRKFLSGPTGWGIIWGDKKAMKRKHQWRENDVR